MPWPTPTTAALTVATYALEVPDGREWRRVLRGALLELTRANNFDPDNGGMDIEDVAEIFQGVFDSWRKVHTLQPGDIIDHAGPDTPADRLECDGATYGIGDYPELFEAIGYTWGGDRDEFQVPNFEHRVSVAAGDTVGFSVRNLGDTGGMERVQLTVAEMPAHKHTNLEAFGSGASLGLLWDADNMYNPGLSFSGVAGGDQSHENMPPFAVVRRLIVCR